MNSNCVAVKSGFQVVLKFRFFMVKNWGFFGVLFALFELLVFIDIISLIVGLNFIYIVVLRKGFRNLCL